MSVRSGVLSRRGEDSDQLARGEEVVTVLDNLVCADDEVEVVIFAEFVHNRLAVGVADPAVVVAPASRSRWRDHSVGVGVRIGPKEVAE